MDSLELILLFDYYGDVLTERQKQCFDLHYNQDLSLGEIAQELHISRQAVYDNLSRTEALLKNMEEKTHIATTYDEFCEIAENKPGFIKAMWCGETECEEKLKDATGGVKSRCIPFEEEHLSDTCVCCGKPAKHMVYWGKQY